LVARRGQRRGATLMRGSPAPVCAAIVLLAGCAAAPEAPPATAPVAVPAPAPPVIDTVPAFAQQQRDAAQAAARQGRWADAVWAWDVVLALRPGDVAAREARAAAQASAQHVAAEREARAHQARQRGDLDGAIKLYLEALAVAPDDASAADALRDIERARTRRGNLVGPRSAQSRPPPSAGRNELEHASMLASQGEFESAIALLAPLARSDARARAQLADIYWRQAQRLEANDRAGAIAALRRCLLLEPGHKAAAQKLAALSTPSG